MYKTYFIDTFHNNGDILDEVEHMEEDAFKQQAEEAEFIDEEFDDAFDSALDNAYMNGLALLENPATGRTYRIDRDSDEYQILQLARNHPEVDFEKVIEGVNADSRKFAKAWLDALD